MLTTLFWLFFKIGFFSFGGGYSMIPLIEQALAESGIELSAAATTNVIAIAGISPGPVGVNLAIGFGYELAGYPGVLAATLGVVLPSLIIVTVVALLFEKIYHSATFQEALWGLHPVVTGIILYAACSVAMKNNVAFGSQALAHGGSVQVGGAYFNLLSLAICAAAFLLLRYTKLHPIVLIAVGAVLGMLFF